MNNLAKDVEIGVSYLKEYKDKYLLENNYDLMFLHTNEDIDKYFQFFPIKDSNILTVIGSGDYILEAIKDGGSNIHAFDINTFSLYLLRLKIAACQVLNYQDYYNYIYYNNNKPNKILSRDKYSKFRDNLDNMTKIFWDMMYSNNLENNYSKILITDRFNFYNNSDKSIKNEENFQILKDNMKNVKISYYNSDIFEILKFIPNDIKFDSIFLSNIFDYLNDKNDNYEYFVKNNLNERLTDKGIIAVYTTYCGLYNKKIEKYFPDSLKIDEHNKVAIYKKKKY